MTDRELEVDVAKAWADPRGGDGFDPSLFPQCGNAMIPQPGAGMDLRSERRLQFLAVYYRLNCAYKVLDQLDHDDGRRAEVLQRIERLSIARDILEDKCAPIGFIGEPQMDGLYASALDFTEPPTRQNPTDSPTLSSLSLCIRIPLPGEDPDGEASENPGEWVEVKTLDQVSLPWAAEGSDIPAVGADSEVGRD